MRRRRGRPFQKNPSAFGTFILEHPYLFTFFVLPVVIGVPIALIRLAMQARAAAALPPSPSPTPAKLPPDIPIAGARS